MDCPLVFLKIKQIQQRENISYDIAPRLRSPRLQSCKSSFHEELPRVGPPAPPANRSAAPSPEPPSPRRSQAQWDDISPDRSGREGDECAIAANSICARVRRKWKRKHINLSNVPFFHSEHCAKPTKNNSRTIIASETDPHS